MRMHAVILPELGLASDDPILVSHWYARQGEEVWQGDRLVELLIGAATFDVSSPASGRLVRIRVREDQRVQPGQILAHLAVDDESHGPPGDTTPP